jgi:hypothetical protein
MATARRHHTATLLQNGKVLITGGENEDGGTAGAELYDPDLRTFTQVADMLDRRFKHTATLLPDGNVFIAGGANVSGSLKTTEIYDASGELFTSGPSMEYGRYDHTATLLPNGWVLFTGGDNIFDDTVEIYDWYNGAFLDTASLLMTTGRDGHTAVQPLYAVGMARFENGSTTVTGTDGSAGGYENTAWTSAGIKRGDIIMALSGNVPYLIDTVAANSIELADNQNFSYDDSGYAGTSTDFNLTGGLAPNQGFEPYIIISQDVYIAGGEVSDSTTEVFDLDDGNDEWAGGVFTSAPADYLFTSGVSLNDGRYGHTLTGLADMTLLVTGGRWLTDGEYSSAGADPDDFHDDTWTASSLDTWEWKFHTSFLVPNNMVIIVNGHSAQAFFTE